MSKNINPMLCNIVIVALLSFTTFLTCSTAWGQQQPTPNVGVKIYFRGDNVDGSATCLCSIYTASSGNPLTTSKHSLPNNPRYLEHVAPGSLSYPEYGVPIYHPYPVGYKTYTDVPAVIDAFWEYYFYGDYDEKISGADPSKNCHGYSTGTDVWLNDFTKLMSDDYTYYLFSYDLADGAIVGASSFGYGDHSIKIDTVVPAVSPMGKIVTSISEKCRDSGCYRAYLNQKIDWYESVKLNVPLGGSFQGFWKKN